MSVASATRQIKFIKRGGTFSTTIICDKGDLWQEYDNSTPKNLYPTISAAANYQPILYLLVTSSRSSVGEVKPQNWPTYIVNGTTLTFDSNDKSTNSGMTGKFKRVLSGKQYGLQVLQNIGDLNNYNSIIVTMKASVTSDNGNAMQGVQASYTISIKPLSETGCSVHIVPGDDKNFVIRENGEFVLLTAKAWQVGQEIASGLTYAWYKMVGGAWVAVSSLQTTDDSASNYATPEMKATATAQTLKVTEKDVATYGEFKVSVKNGASLIGEDTQGVWDVQDPYNIEVKPTRNLGDTVACDETIYEGDSTQNQVCYEPKIVSRDTSAEATQFKETVGGVEGYYFFFTLVTSAGLIVNNNTNKLKNYTITEQTVADNGYNDLELIIESAYGQ